MVSFFPTANGLRRTMSTPPIDLDACAREPIHIPGSIQPHGVLLAIDPGDGRVLQASANAAAALGVDDADLLGRDYRQLLGITGVVSHVAVDAQDVHLPHAPARLRLRPDDLGWVAAWHMTPQRWLVELEPAHGRGPVQSVMADAVPVLRELELAPGIVEASQRAASAIRRLLGYDRVMVYRFDNEWHGDVIAEAHRDGLESYYGLHYPATDIPAQARALYLRQRVRQIVDVGYVPVQVEPVLDPRDGQPLDMSDVSLRSVSPVHCEYLGNMGVSATLVVSLVVNDRLWGLIACHHYTPYFVNHGMRDLAETISRALSARVGGLAAIERSREEALLMTVREKLITAFSEAESMTPQMLADMAPDLVEVVDADGVAIFHGDRVTRHGRLPDEEALLRIRTAIEIGESGGQMAGTTGALHSDRIGEMFPELADLAAEAAGFIFVPLLPQSRSALLWTRREQVRTVNWAGNPDLSKLQDFNGARLSPRKSFELWQTTVRARSRAWSDLHLDSARNLRVLIELMERKRYQKDVSILEATLVRLRQPVAIVERALPGAAVRLVFANPAFAAECGIDTASLIGCRLTALPVRNGAGEEVLQLLEDRLLPGVGQRVRLPVQNANGQHTDWDIELEPLPETRPGQSVHWLLQLRPAARA